MEREMSYLLSPKATMNLMQNNDLPPPTKLFSGRGGMFVSSISKIYDDHHIQMYGDDNKLEILKALHLSQTRATEAESKLRIASADKEALSRMLVDESMLLFAHRHWVNLLEFQLLQLERERREEERERNGGGSRSSNNWCAAMALCFAFAGVTFALGSRYFF